MKLEAGWWFGKMKDAVLEKDSERATEEVKKEAEQIAKDDNKFPENLLENPPKDWLREWEEKHS